MSEKSGKKVKSPRGKDSVRKVCCVMNLVRLEQLNSAVSLRSYASDFKEPRQTASVSSDRLLTQLSDLSDGFERLSSKRFQEGILFGINFAEFQYTNGRGWRCVRTPALWEVSSLDPKRRSILLPGRKEARTPLLFFEGIGKSG